MILCKLASHCAVVVCWLGSGHDHFAFVLRLDQIFQRFWRFRWLDDSGVINDADHSAAIGRAEIWIDDRLWEKPLPKANRISPKNRPFGSVAESTSWSARHRTAVYRRATSAVTRSVTLLARVAPIIHFQSGFFFECRRRSNPSCRFQGTHRRRLFRLLFWPLRRAWRLGREPVPWK